MSEQLLTILKLCLLALLYLFFFRVLRAVWAEVRVTPAAPGTPGPAAAAAPAAAAPSKRGRSKGAPTELFVIAPPERQGTSHQVGEELTVGRAAGCQITLPDDTFVSSIHARVFRQGGLVYVEDLGSTNGTFVNKAKVGAPTPLGRGDRLQVGSTTFEAR